MPQLRSGARRGRRTAVATNKGKARAKKVTGGIAGKRTAGKRVDDVVGGKKEKEVVVVGCGGDTNVDAAVRGTACLKVGEDSSKLEEVREVVKMDECDSGGNGSGKGLGAEDEGSTTPIPERVR